MKLLLVLVSCIFHLPSSVIGQSEGQPFPGGQPVPGGQPSAEAAQCLQGVIGCMAPLLNKGGLQQNPSQESELTCEDTKKVYTCIFNLKCPMSVSDEQKKMAREQIKQAMAEKNLNCDLSYLDEKLQTVDAGSNIQPTVDAGSNMQPEKGDNNSAAVGLTSCITSSLVGLLSLLFIIAY